MAGVKTSPTFAREREIFFEALDLPSADRDAFIARTTAGCPEVATAVYDLLANHRPDEFLEKPATNLASAQLRPSAFEGDEEAPGQFIGRYQLLETIGEGGCGTVYLAEQREPVRRQVALKIIKLGMDTRSVVARFEAERQALALMDHPSIAKVLDGGATCGGRPYFVMELVRGVRITDFCAAHQLAIPERLRLFIALCQAIQHAHQKGVIHRDIKPSNVLVTMQDSSAVPKVIDFGIAKAIEEPLTEKTIFTHFQGFIGTPAYTSPEQARMAGADVDTRSDIYSLGVLLYELLTGVTPFDAKTLSGSGLDEMRRLIQEVDPPLPSSRLAGAVENRTARLLERDLDWIVMKCLEKDRTRRYSTAQELAADLQRYLNDEPVLARPPSTGYRMRKAIHRYRGAFAAGTAVLLALFIGAGLSLWQAVRATQAEHTADQARVLEAALRQKAEREREKAIESQRRAEINEYIADINLAHQSILAGNLVRASTLLEKHEKRRGIEDVRGFEWRYLKELARGDDHGVLTHETGSVRALAASSNLLAVGSRQGIAIYEWPSRRAVQRLPAGAASLAFSASGLLAAVEPGALHLWAISNWTELRSLRDRFPPVGLSPDGRWLATRSRAGVELWRNATNDPAVQLAGASAPFVFAPQSDSLATAERDGIVLWKCSTGTRERVLENSSRILGRGWVEDQPVIRFSPDGRLIVAARNARHSSAFSLQLWEASSGKQIGLMPGEREAPEHTGTISSLAFSPDGKQLVTASWDHSVRLWDLEQRRCLRTIYGSLAEVWAVTFSPDGKQIISGGKDGNVLVWPVEEPPHSDFLAGDLRPVRFSPDSRTLLAQRNDDTLVSLNLLTHSVRSEIPLSKDRRSFPFASPALSSDLRTLAEPIGRNGIRIRNLGSNAVRELQSPMPRVDFVILSPNGSTVVAGGWQQPLTVWDLRETSAAPEKIEGDRALFSADSRVLIVLDRGGFTKWDWPSRTRLTNLVLSTPPRFSVALSPDGETLAAGSDLQATENAIRLWNTRNGELLATCAGHTQGVGHLAFSPDGKTLASTSTDGTLRLWNTATGQQLLAIAATSEGFSDLVFSPDGQWLVCKTWDGDNPGLRFFSAPSQKRPD